MRAEPTFLPDGGFQALWIVEKPKIEQSYHVIEFDADKFNKFCDEIEIDKPKYLVKQGIKPEQVRDAHATYIPKDDAMIYRIMYKIKAEKPIFIMLGGDDKARYVCFKIIQALGLTYPGKNIDYGKF